MPQASRCYEMLVLRVCQGPGKLSQPAAVGCLELRHLSHPVFEFLPLLTLQVGWPPTHRFSITKRPKRCLKDGILAGGLLEKRKRSWQWVGPPVDFVKKLH